VSAANPVQDAGPGGGLPAGVSERRRGGDRRFGEGGLGWERPPRKNLGEAVIEFHGIWKAFGPNSIYEGLDLTIHRGETITIVGGSGTGKSVLLKCLLRLLVPDRGRILAFGEEVTGRNEAQMQEIRRRIGMLFQGAALFDSLNVLDNIAYPLREHGWRDEGKIESRVAEVLDLVNLPGVERKWPAELSGGMKKRVGLARAIAIEPEVILYDEPTTGLDPTNVKRIDQLIIDMQERLNVTSIVVTHDMDSAFRVSDRLAMLYDRRIVWCGFKDEVAEATNPVVQDFIHGNIGGD
jgi:phospholipid/cholesterol/gamma-HCH transport system ATP-binding protein